MEVWFFLLLEGKKKKKSIKWPIVPTSFLLRQLAGRAFSPVQQKANNGVLLQGRRAKYPPEV